MQKIRCPRCAVINLEKFVTFPRCAGCGVLLPETGSSPTLALWRRPVGSLLWASVVGCVAMGLVIVATVFEETPPPLGQLVVYGQGPRAARVGGLLVFRLTVDAVEEASLREGRSLKNVSLRLPRDFFKKFRFVSLDPSPDEVTRSGFGRYFHYQTLPRETRLRLVVRAQQAGQYRLIASLLAEGRSPAQYRSTIMVGRSPQPPGRRSNVAAISVSTAASRLSDKRLSPKRLSNRR